MILEYSFWRIGTLETGMDLHIIILYDCINNRLGTKKGINDKYIRAYLYKWL